MPSTDPDHSSKQPPSSDPNTWLDRYGDLLYKYALVLINDSQVAEDLVQETLLAALKGRASFAAASTESTWLIAILKNKAADHYRKYSRETRLDQPDMLAETDIDYLPAGSWQPSRRPSAWSIDQTDPVERDQFWEHLQRCVDGLDDKLARVYTMRDVNRIDYREVCNTLAVSATNLRVMLYRARKQMRRCLEKNWVDE